MILEYGENGVGNRDGEHTYFNFYNTHSAAALQRTDHGDSYVTGR